MASILIPEGGILNDNSGTLVAVINADTSADTVDNAKVQGLVNLGANAFSAYPLVVSTDLPSANESHFVANDNTGNLMTILNDDTSATTLVNTKLAGPLVSSISGSDGIVVTNPAAVGAADLSLSGVPNTSLAGPLVSGITGGTGITVTGNPVSGTGSPTVAVTGMPIVVAHAQETELTAITQTTVATYTPAATGRFTIFVYFRVKTAATNVLAQITYYDADAVQKTEPVVPNNSFVVDDYQTVPVFIVAGSGGPIDVNFTAGTANQVYASADIWQSV